MTAWLPDYRRPRTPSTRPRAGRAARQAWRSAASARADLARPSLLALSICLALALPFALTACASHYDAGRSALDAGRYDDARDQARAGLGEDPGDGPLLLILARAHLGLDEPGLAARFAEEALASGDLDDAERTEAHLTAARAFAAQPAPVASGLHYLDAEALGARVDDPELPRMLREAGTLSLDAERWGDALRLLRRYHAFTDGDDDALAADLYAAASGHLARMLGRGEYDEAMALAETLGRELRDIPDMLALRGVVGVRLDRDPDSVFAEYLAAASDPAERAARLERVGDELAALQRFDAAMTWYDRALTEDPARTSARLARLRALLATERWGDVGAEVDALASAAPSPEARVDALAAAFELLVAANRADEALAVLRAHHLEVDSFALTGYLAAAYLRRGQRAEASAAIEAWAARAADARAANRAIGGWYREHGDPLAGADYLARNAALGDATAADYLALAQAYDAAGWAYEMSEALRALEAAPDVSDDDRRAAADMLRRQQLWLEASEVLAVLYGRDTANAELREELAHALLEAGLPERAEAVFAEAAEREGARAALRAGEVFIARGSYRQAVPWLERAAADSTTGRAANLRLGEAHLALEDLDAAMAAFDRYVEATGGDADAWENVLARLDRARRHDAAADLLARMVAAHPERQDWALDRADRLRDAGQEAAMRAAYRAYVLDAADPGAALYDAVLALLRRDRRDDARWLLGEVRAAQPGLAAVDYAEAAVFHELANLFRSDWARQQAYLIAEREAYRRFLDGQGQSAEQLARAGYQLVDEADDLAARAFQAAIERGSPEAPLRMPLALALLASGGSVERAVALVRAELASGAAPPGTALRAADACFAAGAMEAGADLVGEALRRAPDAREQSVAFALGAEALTRDGRHEALAELADSYVGGAFDQRRAVIEAATALVRAGRLPAARARVEQALEQLEGDRELVAVLAAADLQDGDYQAALTRMARVAERSATPWRTWREYGDVLRARGALEAAADALARASEGAGAARWPASWDLTLERGLVAAERGLTDEAVGHFEAALDGAAEALAAPARLSAAHRTIDEALRATGHHREADTLLERALADPALRQDALLVSAQVAAARGDYGRAAHALRAYLDGGGAVHHVVDFELAHGLPGTSLDRLGELAVDGSPDLAADLLGRYLRVAAERWSLATVEVWVGALARRGAATDGLYRGLAALHLERGDARRATALLRDLTEGEPTLHLALASLTAQAGHAERATAELERYEARVTAAPDAAAYAFTAASVLALADPDAVGPQLALLADEVRRPLAVAADIERLLQRGDTEAAQRRFLDTLAEASFGNADLGAEETGAALARFAAAGEEAAAASLAAAATAEGGVETALLAIRFGAASGQDIDERVERYRRAAGSSPEALLALAQALVDGGAGVAAAEALVPVLERGNESQALRALDLALVAARRVGNASLLDDAIAAYLERSGGRVGRLVNVALVEQSRGRGESAAQRFLQAFALLPGEPALLREAVECYADAGRFGEIAALAEEHPFALDYAEVLAPALSAALGGDGAPSGAIELVARLRREHAGDLALRLLEVRAGLIAGADEAQLAGLIDEFGGEFDGNGVGEPIVLRTALEALADLDHPAVVALARRVVAAGIDSRADALAADVLWRAGEREDAEAALLGEGSGGADAAATALIEDARVALGWGRFDLARDLADRAVDTDPMRADALALRAAASARLGRLDEARADLEAFLEASELPAQGLALVAAALADNAPIEEVTPLLERLAATWTLGADGTLRFSGLRAALDTLGAEASGDARRALVRGALPYLSGSAEPLLAPASEVSP
jgi:hypothetical protein